ncbi:MAG: hypothetical protein Q9167_008086, partial [Letrouitia subvulpina]
MLDPLTALSLASAIVQFVDFGIKIISETQEIYQSASGATQENVTIGQITQDVKDLSQNVTMNQNVHQAQTYDPLLIKLAESCEGEAVALLSILNELKVPLGASHWTSFKKAIKSARQKGTVQGLEARLDKLQKQVNSRILSMMNDQQSAMYSRLNEIAQQHANMQLHSQHQIEQLRSEIRWYAMRQTEESRHSQMLVEKLHALADEGKRVANEERILKSLRFNEWKRRFVNVKKAHTTTFEWMFEDSGHASVPPTGFKKWLQSQNGIYWICGKAGSGKSTLMKFLSDHTSTESHLRDWAGPDAKLDMIPWFFWSAGSPVQRSQEGLFRSLLYQIMRRLPWLIPKVCSKRWDDDSNYDQQSDPWSLDELSHAIEVLAQQNIPKARFCLLIDGLDEYDGLPNDIIRVLKGLAKSTSFKLCVSSRPWNEFENAFGEGKCDGSIFLEKFTRRDIERVVKDKLEKDETFSAAEKLDRRYGQFVTDVIDRANGVFLRVELVSK